MTDRLVINRPGVYDLSEEVYHGDPCPTWSLSASGITKFMTVPFGGCPARFRQDRMTPPTPKPCFDFGHVAHKLVLGRGADVVAIDATDWRKQDARDQRDAAHAAGKVPILVEDFQKAKAMEKALREHDFAGAAFSNGLPEQSLFWFDEEFGIWCRARLDWLTKAGNILPDYKTCASAAPEDITRAMYNNGGFVQAAWYADAVKALGLMSDPHPIFVFQEKEPPFLVVVVQPTDGALIWGRIIARRAKAEFARCLRTGVWGGYADDVIAVDLPAFAEKTLQNASDMGSFEIGMEFQRPADKAAE